MFRKSLLFTVLLFTFLSVSVNFLYAATTASFSSNYDAPGAKIVINHVVEFTNTSTTTGNVEWISWSVNGVPVGTDEVFTYMFTTQGNYTVTMSIKVDDEDFPINVTRSFPVEPWALFLKSVGFKTANGTWHEIYRDIEQTVYSAKPNGPYSSDPQWQDNSNPLNGNATDVGDKKYPICYTSGSQMQVQVIIEGKGNVPTPIWIRGEQDDGFNFGGANGVTVDYTTVAPPPRLIGVNVINCDKNFDTNKVKFWENFDIEWQAKCGAGNFIPIGHSKNDLHVTWHDPIISPHLDHLYLTLVHIACYNADDKTSESAIFTDIWVEFGDRTVLRKQDSHQLIFEFPYNSANTTTETLLSGTIGTSEAWADFFLDCLKVHGIFSEHNTYKVRPHHEESDKFAINNWTVFGIPKELIDDYPYSNFDEKEGITNKHDWVYNNYNDSSGAPGQSTTNPKSWFEEFYLVFYDFKYYDPAHGERYDSLDEFESQVISAYSKTKNCNVSELDVMQDLNGDGDAQDQQVYGDLTGFVENPSGNQLISSIYTK